MAYRGPIINAVCSLASVGAMCLIVGSPAEAEACSPPPPNGLDVQILAGDQAVHRDGALVLRVSDFDGDGSDADTEMAVAVSLEGEAIPGSIEVLDVLGAPSDWEHAVIVLWRADAEMAAAEDYAVTITYEDGWKSQEQVIESTFSVVDEAAPSLDAITASVSEEITTGLTARAFGDQICCTQDDSCGQYTACVTENRRESLSIRGDYDIGEALSQYTVVRSFSGLSGVADDPGLRLLPGDGLPEGFQPTFNQAFGSYCVAFEAVDVLGGASVMSEVVCLDAPADLVLAEETFDVADWASSCLDDPYWEETEEPWVPDSGSDSDTDGGSDSDTDGGSDSDSDSDSESDTEGSSDLDSDSGTDSGPDSGSDSDGGGGQDGGGGCNLGSNVPASPWGFLGFLGLAGFVFRRRS